MCALVNDVITKRPKMAVLRLVKLNTTKRGIAMTLTEERKIELAEVLIRMGIERELRLEVLSNIETVEEALLFLDKLSEKNYEMTSEEVDQALTEVILEIDY